MNGHDSATAITAFMGWLTSRDEVTDSLSSRNHAGQAVQLIKQFCEAQGWIIDDARFKDDIEVLKLRYPRSHKYEELLDELGSIKHRDELQSRWIQDDESHEG